MEPELNPFSPGSGLRPHNVVGRDALIEAFDLTIARSRGRKHSRGMILYGLRGVGKTVLLNKFREQADRAGWFIVDFEARTGPDGQESQRLGRALIHAASRLARDPNTSPEMREALGSVSSFSQSLGLPAGGIDADPSPGRADSGRLEVDLEEVVEDLSRALRENSRAFGLFIDEMQDLDADLLSALLAAQHRSGQKALPFYIFGAGLPNLLATLSTSRSYAERLFDYKHIGPLGVEAARQALVGPVEAFGARFEDGAAEVLLGAAGGYPYFLQTFGQAAWDVAAGKLITLADAHQAIIVGNTELDMGFFLSRWERVTPNQREYLRAMAELESDQPTTGEVAEKLGKPLSKLSVVRQALIDKTLIFVPERGRVAFSVPGMPAYIRRQVD